MTKITYRDYVDVKLVNHVGSDASVVAAARVSTQGVESIESLKDGEKEGKGLINFLAKNRHGCYDSQTEVLTKDGWKFWPEVDGTEEFITLNTSTDEMEYQKAERLVRKPSEGPMIQMSMAHVDAVVTPDHKMLAAPRTQQGWNYSLLPAKDFLSRSHRLRLGGGEWSGEGLHAPEDAALIGFIAADGHVGSSIEFHLKKQRKIDWLGDRVADCNNDTYRLTECSDRVGQWAKETYDDNGDRCFPRQILTQGDSETITALLDGYLEGDGSVSATGKITASTVSRQMVDDLQEAALKAGMAAVEIEADVQRKGSYGQRTLYRLTFYRERNMEPRIGWTQVARDNQIKVVNYEGDVHCVTVPNGTLYVRRNGKPMWCGNTPFEHNSMTFFVSAPIFVFREFHRHRIGWSFNEESGRYKELEPVFYIPNNKRNLQQIGKTGEYQFVPGTNKQYKLMAKGHKKVCEASYKNYEKQLKAGIAKEVARMSLPLNIYSSMYATCNARSLMSFLGLRTDRPNATFPSKPQREIEMAAELMEVHFKDLFPIIHEAFSKNGRVSP